MAQRRCQNCHRNGPEESSTDFSRGGNAHAQPAGMHMGCTLVVGAASTGWNPGLLQKRKHRLKRQRNSRTRSLQAALFAMMHFPSAPWRAVYQPTASIPPDKHAFSPGIDPGPKNTCTQHRQPEVVRLGTESLCTPPGCPPHRPQLP